MTDATAGAVVTTEPTGGGGQGVAQDAPGDGPDTAQGALVDRIERQAAFLNRNFELLHRRTDIHERLDRADYLMLRTLAVAERSLDINALATMLGLDPSTAGRQVAALRRKGLAETAPDPADRRRSLITPTQEGLARALEVRRLRADGFAELLADWDEEDLRTLGDMFQKYNRAVARRYLTHEP